MGTKIGHKVGQEEGLGGLEWPNYVVRNSHRTNKNMSDKSGQKNNKKSSYNLEQPNKHNWAGPV